MKIIKHANCDKCKLCDSCITPFMESHGADDPIVLVIGEAPGATEDEDGIPFVGKSGQLLRDALLEVGFKIKDIRYTNVVRCRPPENKITKRAINYCKHYVLDEIEHYDPDLVILCGNSPLNAVLGESGITTWNGVVVEREGTVFVPVFHPAYVLRNQEILGDWFDALDKAVDVLVNGQDNKEFERIYPSTLLEVLDMADYLLSQDLIAYDTETGSLDPFAPHNLIPCVSFSAGDRTYAVPLEHSQSPFTGVELDKVVNVIEDILTAPGVKLIGHNVKFDQMHTRHILDIEFKAYGDTMLVSHMLDSRRGIHGLKRLAGLHLGMYDYDKPLNDYIREHPECNVYKGGSYANIILDVLLPYAALDTEATLKLWKKLFPKLSKKQQSFFLEVIMGASNALAGLEYNGNAVDMYIAERYVHVYSHIQRMQYESLLQDRSVHRTVAHFQKSSDMKIVDDITSRYADPKIKIGETHITYDTGTRKGKRKRNMIEFNPNSADHLRYLYFREYKIPVTGKTESGLPSTAADIMRPFIKDYPVVRTVTYYKLLTKMLGTYIQPAATGEWLSGDGRVRSSYNLHGTRTGRLSSSSPNMQNIPTPEKEADNNPTGVTVHLPIKNIFTHTYDDGVLMSVDYSGMELRVFASLAACEPMLEIHRMGGDFHSMVALMAQTGRPVADISKEESQAYKKQYPEVRYRYKWTNWTLLYGGDKFTLISLYGMSQEEAESTVDSYYKAFPEVLEFREYCVAFAEDNGYIESPFGRREHLPYISDRDRGKRNKDRRSAVNMPVQSSASDILLCALVVIDDQLRKRGLRTMLVNTVHDSIVLDVPRDEICTVADLCVSVMENITIYAKDYFPSVDFSWLKSPLKADVEVGTHYGTEINYKEWLEEQNAMLQM